MIPLASFRSSPTRRMADEALPPRPPPLDAASRAASLRRRADALAAEAEALRATVLYPARELARAKRASAEAAAAQAKAGSLFRRHAGEKGVLDREGLRGVMEAMGLVSGSREVDAESEVPWKASLVAPCQYVLASRYPSISHV